MTRKGGNIVLFGADGEPFDATATLSAWRGAGQNRRTRSWTVDTAHVNAYMAGDVASLRARSHDLARKSPWSVSASESYVANCIGTGIVPRPLIEDDELRRVVIEAWEDFVKESDSDGTQDFYGQQALGLTSMREGGDCFIRLRPREERDGLCVPLQVQLLEAEHVDPAYNEYVFSGSGRIQAGIEFDALNRRKGYWMYRDHPGDMLNRRSLERVFVPSVNVLHLFQPQRPGQIRGVPQLAPALATLYELDKYDDAELARKQIAAMLVGFVTSPNPQSDPFNAGSVNTPRDKDNVPMVALEPGTMQKMLPGEDVKFSSPAESGSSYEPFTNGQFRKVAATAGVTFEAMTGDLSRVNFSSIRYGLIEIRRRMDQKRRHVVVHQLCQPTWERFIQAGTLCGRIPMPSDKRILRQMRRAIWTPTPGEAYVDPEKEIRAIILKLRAGLTTRARAAAEAGFPDVEALDNEIAAENERTDRLKLRFDGDGRYGAAGGPAAGAGGAPGTAGAGAFEIGQEEEADEESARSMLRAIRRMTERGELEF